MKLFSKSKSYDTEDELPKAQKKIDLETLIDQLAAQQPKAMEKIMTLAKARREYNQKLESLRKSIEGSQDDDPDALEESLEALSNLGSDSDYSYLEITNELKNEIKVDDKKKKEE